MPADKLQTVDDFIRELNEHSDASFSELANHFDVWATQSDSTRKQLIEYVAKKTGRDFEERMDSQPISSGDFVDFPVVIFSPR
ncbi:hypothetical protein [Actibacterium sp. D379-3]